MSASTNSHKTWNNFDILQNKSKYLKGQLGSPVSDERIITGQYRGRLLKFSTRSFKEHLEA